MTIRKPSIAECDAFLTGPGQILEIQQIELYGRPYRVWKNAPKTFRSFILESLDKYHSRPFISAPRSVQPGDRDDTRRETVSFAEVRDRSYSLAAWMQRQGLGNGSRIAIAGSNCVGWVVAFCAIHMIGGIAVCLNAMLPPDILLHCISTVEPHLLLVDPERAEVMAKLLPRIVSPVYAWGVSDTRITHIASKRRVRHDVPRCSPGDIRSMQKAWESQDLGPESDAVIFFSSGTSGPPKAVLSTQRMALTNLWSGIVAPARAALRAGLPVPPLPTADAPQRTVLLSIPLFHVTGCLSWLMRAFFAGSKMVMMRRWDVAEAARLIEHENVTVIGGVPAVVAGVLQSPEVAKARSFETVFYGGAPPSKQLASEVKARWPKTGLVQGYGMTETNAYVCSIAGADYTERPDSTGPAVPVADIKIVDASSRKELPQGKVGVLLVRGPQVMKRYYGDLALDSDGWLDTGDLAEVDHEGFVYIRDRLKDIIIRGGENITSSEVENALHADDRISEAVAIGVPDPLLGEVVGALVSLRSGHKATAQDILRVVAGRLPKYAVPTVLVIHDGPLPRNVNGKIVKKDLRPILLDARSAASAVQSVKAKL